MNVLHRVDALLRRLSPESLNPTGVNRDGRSRRYKGRLHQPNPGTLACMCPPVASQIRRRFRPRRPVVFPPPGFHLPEYTKPSGSAGKHSDTWCRLAPPPRAGPWHTVSGSPFPPSDPPKQRTRTEKGVCGCLAMCATSMWLLDGKGAYSRKLSPHNVSSVFSAWPRAFAVDVGHIILPLDVAIFRNQYTAAN